jgi:hypothetical protein
LFLPFFLFSLVKDPTGRLYIEAKYVYWMTMFLAKVSTNIYIETKEEKCAVFNRLAASIT